MGEAAGAINYLAVLAAAASAFALGAIWYAPQVFGKAWMKEAGVTEESAKGRNFAMIMGGAFALSLVAAFVFAMFVGPSPDLVFATMAGLSAGLCWVGASFGINYLFEGKSLKLFLINGGYHTVQFTLYGVVLGLWH